MTSDRAVEPHPRRRRWTVVLAAVALTLALSACSQGTVTRSITIATTGGSAGFAPTELTVDKADTVVLTVQNTTSNDHGFSIAGQEVEEIVPAGETVEIRFTAVRAGTFKIFCQLHEGHQTATLTVR